MIFLVSVMGCGKGTGYAEETNQTRPDPGRFWPKTPLKNGNSHRRYIRSAEVYIVVPAAAARFGGRPLRLQVPFQAM